MLGARRGPGFPSAHGPSWQRGRGVGREAEVPYRVWVRAWVAREEVFEDRDSAELFRLKLAASRPTLNPSDVTVVSERAPAPAPPTASSS